MLDKSLLSNNVNRSLYTILNANFGHRQRIIHSKIEAFIMINIHPKWLFALGSTSFSVSLSLKHNFYCLIYFIYFFQFVSPGKNSDTHYSLSIFMINYTCIVTQLRRAIQKNWLGICKRKKKKKKIPEETFKPSRYEFLQ